MSRPKDSFEPAIHDQYLTPGKKWRDWGILLESHARTMLSRTRIHSKLEEAKVLCKMAEAKRLVSSKSDEECNDWQVLTQLFYGCWDRFVDDVLLISAYEMYFKSVMLRNRYVVHEIESPSDLKKQQRIKPIHVNTVRLADKSGSQVRFSGRTIGISQITSTRYQELAPLTPSEMKGMKSILGMRNKVHMFFTYVWSLDEAQLDFVDYLDKNIRSHDKLYRKNGKRR